MCSRAVLFLSLRRHVRRRHVLFRYAGFDSLGLHRRRSGSLLLLVDRVLHRQSLLLPRGGGHLETLDYGARGNDLFLSRRHVTTAESLLFQTIKFPFFRFARGESRLPVEDLLGEVLVDESLVVRHEFRRIGHSVGLAVKIGSLEPLYPREGFSVAVIHQVLVLSFVVPRVEAVETYHLEGSGRKRAPVVHAHLVHVLVVTPRHVHVIQPAFGRIHAEIGVVERIFAIGILHEELIHHDLARVLASDRKRISDDVPLG